MIKKAVFLDRDGVLNRLVYNPVTKEYESPHCEKDLKIFPGVAGLLKKLQEKGFLLFIISNQPSYAKGKATLKNIQSVHRRMIKALKRAGVKFRGCYYCYHHPRGVVKKYSFDCLCRKPKPFFLLLAKEKYKLDMDNSWFVGDQDFDVLCGQAAQVKTILINEEHSKAKRGQSRPDYFVKNLKEAVTIIMKGNKNE